MAAAKTVVATTHFSYADDTEPPEEVHVHAGDRFTETHPVVKRYPEWFVPEGEDVERPQRTRRSKQP
jgi:hypothetical protein